MLAGLVLHHIGVGTTDLEAAVRAYESLGYGLKLQLDDPELGVRVAFLGTNPPWIEIVAPLDASGGPLKALLARGSLPTPYHTCYAVNDLPSASKALSGRGFMALGKPRASAALGGAQFLFHMHRAIGLVELVENPSF